MAVLHGFPKILVPELVCGNSRRFGTFLEVNEFLGKMVAFAMQI